MMTDWPIGLSTGCFYQTSIFDCLELVRHAGFGVIEVCSCPKHLDYHDAVAVDRAAKLIRKLGLTPFSFHAPFAPHIDITSLDEEIREQSLQEMEQAATSAANLGVQYFVVHPGPEQGGLPESERFERMENAVAVLERLNCRCQTLGVGLVLENMLAHLFSGHVRDLMWTLGALHCTDVGICLDTGHAFLAKDLNTIAHKLSGHLWMVHASDNKGTYDDHLPPGDGKIAWTTLLEQFASIGFHSTIILELSGDLGTPEEILNAALRGRTLLRETSKAINISHLKRHASSEGA